MTFFTSTHKGPFILFIFIALAFLPILGLAQSGPYAQLIVTTQVASGVPFPSTSLTVTVNATGPSLSSTPSSSGTLTYPTSLNNDTKIVTLYPSQYTVSVAGGTPYLYAYSSECSGTAYSGEMKQCTVTAFPYIPPPPLNPPPPLPPPIPLYLGPLTCSPSYQTVSISSPVTFNAYGGTGTYNWTTADRSFINVGSRLSVVLQTMGIQTVIVSSGSQSATCTINVVGGAVAVTYPGQIYPNQIYPGQIYPAGGIPQTAPATSVVYVPKLPNTGFAPIDAASIAFTLVFLLAASLTSLPYARKALAVVRS